MGVLSSADRFLLDQIRGGSGEGWSQLVERYEGRLLAFARGRLRGAADAEDVVQETLLSFLQGLERFRGDASLETYLFTICRRKIVNWHRGRRDNVCLLTELMQSGDESRDGGPGGQLAADDPTASFYARREEAHERQETALGEALAELVERYKKALNFRDLKIVEMLFYCQLRNKDIARIAGVEENFVALTKHRTLKQIRESVARRLGEPPAHDPPDSLLHEIWQTHRLSCPKRSTIGAYVLGTLDPDWQDYVSFHLDRLGCGFCRANLEDMQQADDAGRDRSMHQRIMQSTVGFLRKES